MEWLMCWWSHSLTCTWSYQNIPVITFIVLYGLQNSHSILIRRKGDPCLVVTSRRDFKVSWIVTPFPYDSSKHSIIRTSSMLVIYTTLYHKSDLFPPVAFNILHVNVLLWWKPFYSFTSNKLCLCNFLLIVVLLTLFSRSSESDKKNGGGWKAIVYTSFCFHWTTSWDERTFNILLNVTRYQVTVY